MTVKGLIKHLQTLIDYDPQAADWGITIVAERLTKDFGTISMIDYTGVSPYYRATRAEMDEEHPNEVRLKARY